MIPEAGLQDSFAEGGTGLGYNFSSNDPQKRIDYIFVSPDLTPSDVDITQSTASDRLRLAVTVERARRAEVELARCVGLCKGSVERVAQS